MDYLAHSAKEGIAAQEYQEHIVNVLRMAIDNANNLVPYSKYGPLLVRAVEEAALYHDLGKLDEENQRVLHQGKGSLPIKHWDAGAAALLSIGTSIINNIAALSVYSHHTGLSSLPSEAAKGKGKIFRDCENEFAGRTVRERTNERLHEYLDIHNIITATVGSSQIEWKGPNATPLLIRMVLSCLVDGDHTDTARYYNNVVPEGEIPLLPAKRLELLDRYVESLGNESEEEKQERFLLRQEVYRSSRNALPSSFGLMACDSPVGTGKTTAVMAHLLNVAKEKNLRRIFVVLPFTNIIDQSVGVYREALVRVGENQEKVVAAHHHRAEFEDPETRVFSFLWNAPITVTTAVQFFETLASNQPAALRKLHQVAGSAIFLDEAHTALPAHLWPQAWKWLRELVDDWGCYVVLASGSLTRFWELPEFSTPPVTLPELMSENTRKKAAVNESARVSYKRRDNPLDLNGICDWIRGLPGPRLLILNTVQSAAAVAKKLKERYGRDGVEHLSTALAPIHRSPIITRVKKRLLDPNDNGWTLVATSCVEAGIDFSFRTAAREYCSLVSTIQTAGRINRSGEYGTSDLWSFKITSSDMLKTHPSFKLSAMILEAFFNENKVSPAYCKEAMKREVRQNNQSDSEDDPIVTADRNREFPEVEKRFKVIDQKTVTAIIEQELRERIERRETINPAELQQKSVNIYGYLKEKYALRPLNGFKDLYMWMLDYDDFLGYMAGVLRMGGDPSNYLL
jgi:CRISPR-associated endonuclease/helicase Cas3